MEGRREIPSHPSNFVSILHLRERWLKENERNQTEKEEQKKPEQQVQEQEVQRTELEEKNDRKPEDVKPVVQKPRIYTTSWSRNGSGKVPRYNRAVPASNPPNVNEACEKTENEAVPLIERDKKKKKSKRKSHRKKSRAQNEEIDRTSRTPEENLKEEMRETECEDGVQNGKENVRARKIDEKKEMESQCGSETGYTLEMKEMKEMDRTSRTPEENLKEEMRETECEVGVQNGKENVRARKIDEKKEMESQCGSETGYTLEMKEMENKLSRISVSFEIKRGRNNGFYRGNSQGNRNFRDHRNLRRWAPREQRGVGMIWVRKDELSKAA